MLTVNCIGLGQLPIHPRKTPLSQIRFLLPNPNEASTSNRKETDSYGMTHPGGRARSFPNYARLLANSPRRITTRRLLTPCNSSTPSSVDAPIRFPRYRALGSWGSFASSLIGPPIDQSPQISSRCMQRWRSQSPIIGSGRLDLIPRAVRSCKVPSVHELPCLKISEIRPYWAERQIP